MLNAAEQSRTYKSEGVQANTRLSELSSEDYERNLFEKGSGVSLPLLYEIEDALAQNISSRAFLGHEVEWETAKAQVTRIHTLRRWGGAALKRESSNEGAARGEPHGSAARKGEEEAEGGLSGGVSMPVAAICSNCTGNLLAVCYGRMDIEGTDTRASSVAVWNLQRYHVKANKADYILDTSCSVMSVAFHATHPAILVAGTFSGEVLAWTLEIIIFYIFKNQKKEYYNYIIF
jgi:hypothetical protein